MTRPYIQLGNAKIAPFKYGDVDPYGAFANTTKAGVYPITQQITTIHNEYLSFLWPSAEHAFHAQKLIHLKNQLQANDPRQLALTQTLHLIENTKKGPNEEFSPRDDYDSIIKQLIQTNLHLNFGRNKREFDSLCNADYHSVHNPGAGLMPNGEPYTLHFMHLVLKMKLDQHPTLKQLAMDCANEGIMPVEISQYDENWASGINGQGKNMLGVALLELGNDYLRQQRINPQITNPRHYFDQMQSFQQNQLAHGSLVHYTASVNGWQAAHQPSAAPQQTQAPLYTQLPVASSLSSPQRESAHEYVKKQLDRLNVGCDAIKVVADINNPAQRVIQLIFNNPNDATTFRHQYSGKDTPTSSDGKTLSLGPKRAPLVFKNLQVENYGRTHPTPTMNALINEVQKTTNQQIAAPFVTPSRQSPNEYVQNQLNKLNVGCIAIKVITDINNPAQQVIQLIFNNSNDATKFRHQYSGKDTPTSSDGKILTLGPKRAPLVFKNLQLENYGRTHPTPTMNALINDYQTSQANIQAPTTTITNNNEQSTKKPFNQ